MDDQTYLTHRFAIEGNIFYRNNLADPVNVETYFPRSPGQLNYDRDPHLSLPVTSEIIDRLATLVHGGMKIETSSAQLDAVMTEIMDASDWPEFSRTLVTQPLARGNHLVILRAVGNQIYFEQWQGEYVMRSIMPGYEMLGYQYIMEPDGTQRAVTQPPNDDEKRRLRMVWIDDNFFFESIGNSFTITPHNFGFTPAVLFRSVDKDDEDRYGRGFYLRFRDPLVKYNQTFSQCLKSSIILQNIWKAKKAMEDPLKPIRLNPDAIVYVGDEGDIEQAARQLDLSPEYELLDRMKSHIASAADVPDFMTGLQDVGKVESGVALNIVSGPLKELCTRIRGEYRPKITQLLTKSIRATFALRGQSQPQFELNVTMNENVIPVDKEKELANIGLMIDKGVITAQEARPNVLQLLNMEPQVA